MRTHECWHQSCHRLCEPDHDYCSIHEAQHKQTELQRLHEYHQTEQYHQYHKQWQREYNHNERDPVANAFYHSTQTSLLIFNKKKQTSNILMVNASSLATEEVREQRGQVGSKSHTNRVYKKKINVLPNEAIKKIESFLDKPGDEQGVSKVVPIETIKEQDYVLTPNRYIEMKQEDIQHSSL